MPEPLVFAIIVCAGILVQSFSGFAGALVTVPLFAAFLSPQRAIPAFGIVSLLINIAMLLEARLHVRWDIVTKLMVGGFVGVPLGAILLKHLPLDVLVIIISVVTLTFAFLLLLNVQLRLGGGTPVQVVVGFLSGLLGGAIGQSGPPVVIYGISRKYEKDTFRTMLLTYFSFVGSAGVLAYWLNGMYTRQSFVNIGVALVPAFAMSLIGLKFKNRVSDAFFRRAVLVIVVAVSLMALSRALA